MSAASIDRNGKVTHPGWYSITTQLDFFCDFATRRKRNRIQSATKHTLHSRKHCAVYEKKSLRRWHCSYRYHVVIKKPSRNFRTVRTLL